MKRVFFTALLLLGFIANAGASDDVEKAVKTLKSPVHFGDVRKLFGNLQNGHGPYFWIEDSKTGKDIWFWIIPDRKFALGQAKDDLKQVAIDKFEIPFISSGKSDDPDSQFVIWPDALKGKPIAQVYKDVYKDFVGE